MQENKENYKNPFGISDIDLEIIHCIFHIKKALEIHMNKNVETYKLSSSQIELLACSAYTEDNTSTDLAQKMCVSKANLTGLVSRLEEKKLIKREVNKKDARSKFITVTNKGRKLINQIVPEFMEFLSKTLEHIPSKEKISLETNLKIILRSLKKR